MIEKNSKIIYTETDEAPFLATYSLLPIIKSFVKHADVDIDVKDISLAGRILAEFPENLNKDQRINNDLKELGELVKKKEANIIKLPNISASIPQLISTIDELRKKGFLVPVYPESPKNDLEKEVRSRYDKIKGSAVNPVLREGNSDRRAPNSVKNYAKQNPHNMGSWNSKSKSHVASMKEGDFFHNEKSLCVSESIDVRIEFLSNENKKNVLKKKIPLLQGEIIDSSVMSKKSLLNFIEKEIRDAKEKGVLFSLHMKATMMKVSDPIIFGHVVGVYFKDLVLRNENILEDLGVDFRNGFGDLVDKLHKLTPSQRFQIEKDIESIITSNADLAMVNSHKGISNLHVPSDVIIDASMPAMIRNSGKMWNANNESQDTKAVIPDSSYSCIYSATIDFCKKNGAFNPSKMGTVPNVGLMAQKAEEYGSHDKTFEIPDSGIIRVIDKDDNILLEHQVEKGDIFRMCQTKDEPIRDWIRLAVSRAKATGWPAVFWLNENRAHDIEIIKKVKVYLSTHEIKDLDIKILPPYEATMFTLNRIKDGKNTISITGNVLRDYLTDLFPILELGTSAKMLSIVPLMNGGGLFETGAGGSAPKHVHQLLEEGHLRWDSLGEFLALVASLDHLSDFNNNSKAKVLAETLDSAIEKLLKNGKSPKREVYQLDNRDSHFFLAMYWAEELSQQKEDKELASLFKRFSLSLKDNEKIILSELSKTQAKSQNINGYYYPDKDKVKEIMRPSHTLNSIINKLYRL